MSRKISVMVAICYIMLTSCVSKKRITRFQYDQINQELVTNDYKTIFKPDDLLQISISAQDLNSVIPFNLPAVNFSVTGGSVSQPRQQQYLVDSQGNIDFPILGKIKVGGKEREEVIKEFKKRLDPDYVKNPTINIFIANFKVTVTGDVSSPGTFTIPNERITILEALGLAGDINISGKRDNILVLREELGEKITYRVNLLSNELFTSPVYYLQQNDMVYIEPNYAKAQSAASNKNTGLWVSIGGILISIMSVLTR